MILDDHVLPRAEENDPSVGFQALGGSTGTGSQHSNDHFPLPSDWQELLDKYFHTTHSWLPIAEKHELLKISYSLRAIEAPATGHTTSSRGDNAFLAAAFAYVIQREQKDVGGTRNEELLRLSTFAIDLLDFPGDSNEPGHVRALLLLTLAQIDNNKWDQAWRTVGRAVYMMVSLLDINDAMTMSSAEEGHKRTLLGCFAMEALVATRLKRRTYLSYADVQTLGLLSTNTVEEWEPWQSSTGPGTDGIQTALGRVVSLFNHFMRLAAMMHELQLDTGNAKTQDSAVRFGNWKGQLQQTYAMSLSPHSSPQLLNLSTAVTTMQIMVETQITTQLSPTTLNELSVLVETLEHQVSSDKALTSSLVPSTIDLYLSLIEDSLIQQGSDQASGTQDQIVHILSSIKRLRSVKMEIGGRSRTGERLAADSLAGASVVSSNSGQPQPNNVVAETASLQPPSIEHGIWNVDDDDMLFDTMATLDSTNWIDNLPDFVRGLGSVRTASPDLQALIDGAF
ncbi:hypothetical protein M409DRAFT_28647 [Zasmidium cellare ATCC 36951]|uniref:Xylanolytic transcriptional activator regulatory domain-containing protein n=1 Tax=Zasmidium cellare ATCC 36951 TaxID=1080233 RepID=A0A6A6C1Y8_ZASCE|nr:uncharacterized protein M409DRAFT_28647 [Zasmidium cellare ATCC 36951]KAF2161041.1 hypothetical protein M409DRAFT_28647 [Zasmidium cellare ATCC 36951]